MAEETPDTDVVAGGADEAPVAAEGPDGAEPATFEGALADAQQSAQPDAATAQAPPTGDGPMQAEAANQATASAAPLDPESLLFSDAPPPSPNAANPASAVTVAPRGPTATAGARLPDGQALPQDADAASAAAGQTPEAPQSKGSPLDRLAPAVNEHAEPGTAAVAERTSSEGDAGGGERRERGSAAGAKTARVAADPKDGSAAPPPDAPTRPGAIAAAGPAPALTQPIAASSMSSTTSSTEREPKAAVRPTSGETTSLTPAAREALAPLLALADRVQGAARASEALAQPAPTPQSPSSPSDDAGTNTPLVSRGLGALANQRGGTLSIRLDPPSLGDVRITMTVLNGRVSAELVTRSAEAQTLLRADLSALRQALESQGLSVDRLSVHTAPASNTPSQGHGARTDAPNAMPTHAQPASSGSQSQHNQSDGGGQDRGQQQHDAGHGQSRGRSGDSGNPGQGNQPGQREDREGQGGSRSRRRASFARVFASSTLP